MVIIDSSVQNKDGKRLVKSEFFDHSESAILGTPNSLVNIESKNFISIKPPIPKKSKSRNKQKPTIQPDS